MRSIMARKMLWAIPVLALMGTNVRAQDCFSCPQQCEECEGSGVYVGVFGGGGVSSNIRVAQNGFALFGPADGGPLSVNARGGVKGDGAGLIGLHIGKEFSGMSNGSDGFGLTPALEFEGFYLGDTLKGDAFNPTPRLPEHDFRLTLPVDAGVFLVNAVFNVQTPGRLLTPYVGIGAGTAYQRISGADSLQVAPLEAGVNHFNSGPNSARWNFAWQAKIGAKLNLTERIYVFAEYRYLNLRYTDYTFGPTVSPGHAQTTPWLVRVGNVSDHLGVGGIGFKF